MYFSRDVCRFVFSEKTNKTRSLFVFNNEGLSFIFVSYLRGRTPLLVVMVKF